MKKLIYYVAVALMFLFNAQLFAQTDYVLNGHDEVVAFVAGATGVKETVGNFTVSGADVTQTDFNSLADRVGIVSGTVTFHDLTQPGTLADGTTVSYCGPFFQNVTVQGGMVFRNCPYLTFPEGITDHYTKINGDFIVDNCPISFPDIDGWGTTTFFGSFTEVTGNFIITNCPGRFVTTSAQALTTVGGNFEISNPTNKNSWELGFKNLKTVGGNFTIDGNNLEQLQWWSLNPLTSLESIGGDVKIVNMPGMGISGQGGTPFGYCYVRYLIDAGIIDYAHHDVQIGNVKGGSPIDLATLGGCSDGITPDNPPVVLPPKLTTLIDLKTSINKVNIVNETLTVDSRVDLSKVELFNLTGSSLLQFSNVPAGVSVHSVSSLMTGVYFIRLATSDNKSTVYKVVK
jgi:hypothetical protein